MRETSASLLDGWSRLPRSRRLAAGFGVVLLLGVGYSTLPSDVVDIRADRLVSLAVIDGLNPHTPIPVLAAEYGSPLAWTWVHPRTPGALVLQLPIAFIPEDGLAIVSAWSAAVLIALLALASLRLAGLAESWLVPAMLTIGATGPAIQNVFAGAQSLLVAVLIAFTWTRLRESDGIGGGVALGVAITLKLFPWTLLPVLFVLGRRRALITAIATGTVVNLGGLLFGAVSVRAALDAITGAASQMQSVRNGSILSMIDPLSGTTQLIAISVMGLVLVTLVARQSSSFDAAIAAAVVLGLGLSPLVWAHYLLVLIPVVAWIVRNGPGWMRFGLVGIAALWYLPDPDLMAQVSIPLSVGLLTLMVVFVALRPAQTETDPSRLPAQ